MSQTRQNILRLAQPQTYDVIRQIKEELSGPTTVIVKGFRFRLFFNGLQLRQVAELLFCVTCVNDIAFTVKAAHISQTVRASSHRIVYFSSWMFSP